MGKLKLNKTFVGVFFLLIGIVIFIRSSDDCIYTDDICDIIGMENVKIKKKHNVTSSAIGEWIIVEKYILSKEVSIEFSPLKNHNLKIEGEDKMDWVEAADFFRENRYEGLCSYGESKFDSLCEEINGVIHKENVCVSVSSYENYSFEEKSIMYILDVNASVLYIVDVKI